MPEPAVRASDDDRDMVLQALERHLAAGRLDLDEFDQRSTAALSAVTLNDLVVLTSDLPQPTAEASRPVNHFQHLTVIFLIAFATLAVLLAMMLLHP